MLLGPSGCGKTTLLCSGGILRPKSGATADSRHHDAKAPSWRTTGVTRSARVPGVQSVPSLTARERDGAVTPAGMSRRARSRSAEESLARQSRGTNESSTRRSERRSAATSRGGTRDCAGSATSILADVHRTPDQPGYAAVTMNWPMASVWSWSQPTTAGCCRWPIASLS